MSTQQPLTEHDVLVVGAGPVGMFLGALLGWRGVSTLLVERNTEPSKQAKIMTESVRTMEFCRQMGFADEGHDWGFPHDWPMNNVWVTSLDGYELSRVDAAPLGTPGAVGFSDFSPQFQVHCPQPWWERIVERQARSHSSVDVRRGYEFEGFEEVDDGVISSIRNLETGAIERVRSAYLVACEGFGGRVSQQLAVPVEERTIDYSVDVEFICEDLLAEHDKGPAWRYTLIDSGGTWGTLVAVNGKDRWRLSIYNVARDEADSLDLDAKIIKAVGHDFPYQILVHGRWKRRTALAASYGRGRILLAGDTVHANPPNGAFGMNAGVADAANLAWKLQAALEGWAGPDLLPSYGAERRPIAQMTLAEALRNYHRLVDETAYSDIAEDTEQAAEHRRLVGVDKAEESLKAWRPIGIHLGYGYPWSSVVCSEPGSYPGIDLHQYVPSTDPGFRAPHVWLGPDHSVLDLFGRSHVLLRIATDPDAGAGLIEAAQDVGMPLAVEDISGEAVEAVYDYPLVLVRPDGHIAWRGEADPKDPLQVINRIRGYAGSAVPPPISKPRGVELNGVK